MGFPGILKGCLLIRARKVTDEMANAAAYSMADFAMKKGIDPDYIMPTMDETEVFAKEAADVAMVAIKAGLARIPREWDWIYQRTLQDIKDARATIDLLMKHNLVKPPDISMLETALEKAIAAVKK